MIPLKLETLLKGRVVESDRVEYKRGWNPSEVITTICAYANDFSNTNGGYVVVGLEEILVNSIFHKSYQIAEPVEIRIYVDCIKVINHPGPERYIDIDELKTGKAVSRRYRNRRIGEFLKEIDLSEKKSTGITKILNALEANGSPLPEFETDGERNYMIVTIYPHEGFDGDEVVNDPINDLINDPINDLVNNSLNKTQQMLYNEIRVNGGLTYQQLSVVVGISEATVKRNLKKLQELNCIKRVGSNKIGYWEIIE